MSEKSMMEMTQAAIRDLAEQLAEQKKRDAERDARRDADFAALEAQSKRDIAAMRRDIGGMGKSMGEHAEQFFYRGVHYALKHSKPFCGMECEFAEPNATRERNGLVDEFDIVVHNGDALMIVEVKYKFRMEDLQTLVNRKVRNFRVLFPEYAAKKIYLAAAGFSFMPGVVDEAKQLGIIVMQKDGKHIDIESEHKKAF